MIKIDTIDSLVERFKNKDKGAFEKLYNKYSKNICGVIYTLIKDKTRAEEICHDVFLKMWNNAHTYNTSKGRFFTWALNIARNSAIDELRSADFKKQKLKLSLDNYVNNGENSILLEEELEYEKDRMKNLLKNLKNKCIQIIELIYFQGCPQNEVAELLEIPVGTVKSRNRNCIAQLRENYKAIL